VPTVSAIGFVAFLLGAFGVMPTFPAICGVFRPPEPKLGVVPRPVTAPARKPLEGPAPGMILVPVTQPAEAKVSFPATAPAPQQALGSMKGTTYVVNQHHAGADDQNPGTEDRPFKTIAQAAKVVKAGDTVLIRGGVYREKVVIDARTGGTPDRPIRFLAAPGERVVVTGADRLVNWRKEDGPETVHSTDWPHSFINWSKQHTHPDDDYHRLIGRAEQVIAEGYLLRQVLSREQLARGTFFADLSGKRLYVCLPGNSDIAKCFVEGSVRPVVWDSQGSHVQVRGIRFRYAANRAQEAAATFSGPGSVIEDCVFEKTNSIGACFMGDRSVIRRSVFQDNGQMGFAMARARDILMSECEIRNNNTKGFSRGWEAGGNKIVLCRGVVLEKSRFIENRGNGIWFDIGNEDNTVRNCLIANNEDAGIFYEISYGLHAHDNVILGNGFSDTPGSWGAASGISISSSPGCLIERNLIVGNREGFNFREQTRSTPRIGRDKGPGQAVWNHDEVIRNNVLAFNRDAQTWGWFDMPDGRHWPAEMQDKTAEQGQAKEDIAKGYQAGKDQSPTGLNLQKLKITFQGNLYAVNPGQGLFNWGCTWRKHRKYSNLDDVRKELKLTDGCRVDKVQFADLLSLDLRVPADSPPVKMGCYPKGDVPGVRLGITGSD
jgi:hypothetical protein